MHNNDAELGLAAHNRPVGISLHGPDVIKEHNCAPPTNHASLLVGCSQFHQPDSQSKPSAQPSGSDSLTAARRVEEVELQSALSPPSPLLIPSRF